MSQETNFKEQYQKGRNQAVGLSSAVYIGGVFAVTLIFISFVLTAFPETSYFVRGLMVISGLLVGCSAIAFPNALHNWAVGGTHRLVTTILYYIEIAIIVLNTIVSFSALLYTFAGNTLPDWVQWYEPFTIVSLAYVIFAWGTIFITDPQSRAKAKQKEALDRFDNEVAQSMGDYLDSADGKLAVQAMANRRISRSFQVQDDSPQPWIRNGANFSAWNCPYCSAGNQGSAQFCSQCGAPRATQGSDRPALPSPATPALPPRREHSVRWTLDALLNWARISRADARDMIRKYRLFDAHSAYIALDQAGYIPETLTVEDFMPLYCELAGVHPPTWNAIPTAWNPGIHPSSDWDRPGDQPPPARASRPLYSEEQYHGNPDRREAAPRSDNGGVEKPFS